jgi:hypothetical protein
VPPPQNPPSAGPSAPRDERPLWKRALPFAVGALLIGYILYKIDLAAFARHLRTVHYGAFIAFLAVFTLALAAADAVATTFVYRKTICPVKTGEFFLIRVASYLPSMVNHHVGQAWLTWYMSRAYKAPLWRVAGATLLVYATTFGSLFLFGALALFFEHDQQPWLAPCIAIGTIAGLLYLVVIHLKPAVLAKRQVLAPLFEVGVLGHIQALALRIPHMIVLFIGSWAPFWFFGVKIPSGVAFAYLPVLMVVQALPITPQGVGTRDVFAFHYFARFAPGDLASQQAAVAAATLTFAAGLSLVQIILSLFLMPRALAALSKPGPTDTPPPPRADPDNHDPPPTA